MTKNEAPNSKEISNFKFQMIQAFLKRHVIGMCVTIVGVVLMMPAVVFARPQEPEREIVDGRLEGYAKNVTLEGGSTALTWLLMIVLAAICVAALFKNARRTHLD